MLSLRDEGGRLSFAVRVVPRASTNAVAGVRDGALLVRVTAPPVEGRANEALLRVLAKWLDVSPGAVRLERGSAARSKRVSLPSEAGPALRRRLDALA
jgi:uncharacterized protein (TIGR00251 family)